MRLGLRIGPSLGPREQLSAAEAYEQLRKPDLTPFQRIIADILMALRRVGRILPLEPSEIDAEAQAFAAAFEDVPEAQLEDAVEAAFELQKRYDLAAAEKRAAAGPQEPRHAPGGGDPGVGGAQKACAPSSPLHGRLRRGALNPRPKDAFLDSFERPRKRRRVCASQAFPTPKTSPFAALALQTQKRRILSVVRRPTEVSVKA